MTKNDVSIIIGSENGKNIYVKAIVSRTIARKIESLLEENGIYMEAPYREKPKRGGLA